MANSQFWQGKKVLLTGHTGFKGSWLSIWLYELGASVTGISLAPDTSPSLFKLAKVDQIVEHNICDIRDRDAFNAIVQEASPDIVIHMAAQALVRRSYVTPLDTFDSNITGTINVLDCLRSLKDIRVALMITTDKVYADNNGVVEYRENDPLGGHDPYSASKAACEIVIESYRKSFLAEQGVGVASARAGNVIGGGDWAKDRLIPDAVRAWQNNAPLQIRMPDAVRPWQHVLDPLHGYLKLAQAVWHNSNHAEAWNFGPAAENAVCVREVIELARKCFGKGEVEYGKDTPLLHEARYLKLDTKHLENTLGVKAKLCMEDAVNMTMDWYKALRNGEDARQLCLSDIASYESGA